MVQAQALLAECTHQRLQHDVRFLSVRREPCCGLRWHMVQAQALLAECTHQRLQHDVRCCLVKCGHIAYMKALRYGLWYRQRQCWHLQARTYSDLQHSRQISCSNTALNHFWLSFPFTACAYYTYQHVLMQANPCKWGDLSDSSIQV